jgi:hypothetical protein
LFTARSIGKIDTRRNLLGKKGKGEERMKYEKGDKVYLSFALEYKNKKGEYCFAQHPIGEITEVNLSGFMVTFKLPDNEEQTIFYNSFHLEPYNDKTHKSNEQLYKENKELKQKIENVLAIIA